MFGGYTPVVRHLRYFNHLFGRYTDKEVVWDTKPLRVEYILA